MLKHLADEIYRDQTITVIVVFSVKVDVFPTASVSFCYACIEPLSVVICQYGASIAMDMQAQNISINQLCQLVPELQKYL